MTAKVIMPVRLNPVEPLGHKLTAMHTTDTAGQLGLWSGAVTGPISTRFQPGDVDSSHTRRTRATTPSSRTLPTATATGTTRRTSTGCVLSADSTAPISSEVDGAPFSMLALVTAWRDCMRHKRHTASAQAFEAIAEAMSLKRNHVAGSMYLFGNMRGQRYTKGGWKAMLDDLMLACEAQAALRKLPFQRFSLQDCRPKGASDKLDQGHLDTQQAMGHTDGKMLATVYDRRQIKRATPAA